MKNYEAKARNHDKMKNAESKKGRVIESVYHGEASSQIRQKKRNLKHKEKRHLFKEVRRKIKDKLAKRGNSKVKKEAIKPKKEAKKPNPKSKETIKPIKLNRNPTFSEQMGNTGVPLSPYAQGIRDSNRQIEREHQKSKQKDLWTGKPIFEKYSQSALSVAFKEVDNGNPYWTGEDGKVNKNKAYVQGRKDAISSMAVDKKMLVPMEYVKPEKNYPSLREIVMEKQFELRSKR